MKRRDDQATAQISDQAAEWFVRLKDGDLSTVERHRYLQWLKTSPVHIAEMLRMTSVYGVVRDAGLKECLRFEEAGSNIIELSAGTSAPEDLRAPRRRSRWVAAAAVVAAVAAVVFAALRPQSIETNAGEWRHLTLEDGSFVRLGPSTRLRVEFNKTRRNLTLRMGEATFQVARDSSRPFLVHAGPAVVRALGTEFAVERESNRVLVTVAEGSVSVSQDSAVKERQTRHNGGSGSEAMQIPPIAVSAGEQVAVFASRASTMRHVDVVRELAWADRKLIFDNETLGQAVQEFNRRNRLQIEIDDPVAASRPVRGVFDAADPQSFADFLVAAAQLSSARTEKNRIVLKKKGDEIRKSGGL